MRERGVEVYHAEHLLAEAIVKPEVKDWACDHILNEREVGIAAAHRAREWVQTADPTLVAEFLIGGITRADVARNVGLEWESADPTSMLLPPLPNFLFQRDPSCWIYDGVTLNPMTKPARMPETMICEAIYRCLVASEEAISGRIFNVGRNSDNFRVREIAELIAEEFPGCKLSSGAASGDNRSYRVNFDRIQRELPGFECHHSARGGIQELRRLFERIQMPADLYQFRAFTRLKQLNYLQATHQIDQEFFWSTW